jgi:hypothetical protein
MVRTHREAEAFHVLREAGASTVAKQGEWTIATTRDKDAARLAADLARVALGPALGGWVYDSDFAYVTGFGPDGQSFEVMFGEPYETDSNASGAQDLLLLATHEGQIASARLLSAWAEAFADTPIDFDEGLRILESEHIFAEESVAELFDRLSIPNPLAFV